MNTSASGGYLLPNPTLGLPKGLSLNQFLNTVFQGLSNLQGTLVRPRWQVAPPKQPDLPTNWMAFGIISDLADTNAFVGMDADGVDTLIRHEELEIACSFYGPDSLEIAKQVRDGFQIQQNLDALRAANMGYKEVSKLLHMPELINERWFDRYEMSVFLRRQIQRVYPTLSLVTAEGIIIALSPSDQEYVIDWQTET